MKRIITIAVIVLVVGVSWIVWKKTPATYENPNEQESPRETIGDGNLNFTYPPHFGLAVTEEQLLVKSYIPACDPDFDYCFYYHGNEFAGTNFESAGIRIQKRDDLDNEKLCLETPPAGFDATKTPSGFRRESNYSGSIFSQIGNAAAGHYANGEMYRFYLQSGACYEIETRIGESQFGNYPEGSIKKFGESDRDKVYNKFKYFFNNLTLANGQKLALPESED